MKRNKGLGPTKFDKRVLIEIGTWLAVIVVLVLFVYLART